MAKCSYCLDDSITNPCEKCDSTFHLVTIIKCRMCGGLVRVDKSVLSCPPACGGCNNRTWILVINRGGEEIA